MTTVRFPFLGAVCAALLLICSPASAQFGDLLGQSGGSGSSSASASDGGSRSDTVESLLEDAALWREEAERFTQLRRDAPERLAAVREELRQISDSEVAAPDDTADMATLESNLIDAEIETFRLADLVSRLEAEPQRRNARRRAIPQEIAELRSRINEWRNQLGPDDLLVVEQVAEELPQPDALSITAARILAANARIAALEEESNSIDARTNLLTARRDLAARQMQRAIARAALLRGALNEARRAAADADLERARELVEGVDANLRPAAQLNLNLAQERTGANGLVPLVAELESSLHQRAMQLDRETQRFSTVRDKTEALGLTPTTGVILRDELAATPDAGTIERDLARWRERLPELQLNLIHWNQERNTLVDGMEQAVVQLAASNEADRLSQARNILYDRLDIYEQLIEEADVAYSLMIELDSVDRQLLSEIRAFEQFVNERILWVRGRTLFDPRNYPVFADAAQWIFSPSGWADSAKAFPRVFAQRWPAWGGVVAVVALLLILGRRMRSSRARWLTPPGEGRSRLPGILKATGAAVAAALPLPLAAVGFGYLLKTAPDVYPHKYALGIGLLAMGLLAAPLEFFRAISAREGLLDKGLGLPSDSVRDFRNRTLTLEFLLLPVALIGYGMSGAPDARRYIEVVGPVLQVVGQTALAFYMFHILQPQRGLGVLLPPVNTERFGFQVRYLWRPLLTLLPIALTILAVAGYANAALLVAERLIWSLLFPGVLFFAWRLMDLWAKEQKTRIEHVHREVASSASRTDVPTSGDTAPVREASEGSASTGDSQSPLALEVVIAQLERLIRALVLVTLGVGLWVIWTPILPAAGFLNEVQLWSTSSMVEVAAGTEGTGTPQLVEVASRVTAGNVLTMLLVIVVTFVAARNIPGLVEVALLERLPLAPSIRFAVSTIFRYLLVMIGVVVAFNAINIGWSKVQWLAAAFTVGIGFGLQEIFANFVSGLILLFERPIRIGDIVTVGETSGKVSKIRMRATVITDFDELELIVPNKEFVTGRLVNWTLSDPMTRMKVVVGVAYGSDTNKARELLLKVASEAPHVLDDPAPRAIFNSFGDSALLFTLYAYIPERRFYLEMLDYLHQKIDEAYREANITIAFPQMDLHLKSFEPKLEFEARDGRTAEVGPGKLPESPTSES